MHLQYVHKLIFNIPNMLTSRQISIYININKYVYKHLWFFLVGRTKFIEMTVMDFYGGLPLQRGFSYYEG